MNHIKKIFVALGALVILSGCGFQEIKSDSDIITDEASTTTTAPQTLEPPKSSEAPDDSASDPPETDDPVPEPDPYPASMFATANVNARRGPSTAHEIAFTVVYGTEVTIIGYADGWYNVEIGGEKLYIIGDYLSETPPEE